jgi:carbamoyl-phosphate synthase large subunit
MTDPELADATYIEPITPEIVAKIIEKERPDALLPTMGGQTALNTALALAKDGTLERLGSADRRQCRGDREGRGPAQVPRGDGPDRARKPALGDRAQPRGGAEALETVGLPAIIRPSFTLGGTGGGIAYNREEFEAIVAAGSTPARPPKC